MISKSKESKESKEYKVFLCLPMSGRTEEDILNEMSEMTEASIHYFQDKHPDCEIVYMTNYVSEAEEESDNPVYLLGRGIMEKMSQADVCLFSKNWKDSKGCNIEHDIAETYKIDIMDMGVDACLANTAAFYHFGFKQKTLYRMESTINLDETDTVEIIERDGLDSVTLERYRRIIECIKNGTLLLILGVLDRTATDNGYVIGVQPIAPIGSVGLMSMHVNSADLDKLKIAFKEVFDIASIEEDKNED